MPDTIRPSVLEMLRDKFIGHPKVMGILGSIGCNNSLSGIHCFDVQELAGKAYRSSYAPSAPPSFPLRTREELIQTVITDPWNLRNQAYSEIRKDRSSILEIVTKNGEALQFLSEFQSDREIVFAAFCSLGVFSKEDGRDVFTRTMPLCSSGETLFQNKSLFQAVNKIPSEERGDVIAISKALIQSEMSASDRATIVNAIQKGPKAERLILGERLLAKPFSEGTAAREIARVILSISKIDPIL